MAFCWRAAYRHGKGSFEEVRRDKIASVSAPFVNGGIVLKELLEVLAVNLVDNPGMVQVNQTEDERSILLELKVAPEDMGKIIGKQGRIAKAIRTVVKASAVQTEKKIQIDILQ